MPFARSVTTATIALAALSAPLRAQQHGLHGISFEIDTALFDANAIRPDQDAVREWAAFATYTATVTFASGRGRLDVRSRRDGPETLIDSVALARPVAMRGDYYLFDSTGYVLVRPATKTFVRHAIRDDSFNYDNDRTGWPDYFQLLAPHVETIDAARAVRASVLRTYTTYWHADATPDRPIARGRLTMVDAPFGELNVARWFAAARAIAHLVDSTGALPAGRVTVTSAIPRAAPRVRNVPVSFLLKQECTRLTATAVDARRMMIPAEFHESGAARDAASSVRRGDSGDRWRQAPGVRHAE